MQITALDNGGFVVTWVLNGNYNDGEGVFARHYDGQLFGTANAENITDTRGSNWLHGRGGDDVLYGLGGNDLIHGGHGDDTLIGGAGKDTLRGGTGADTFVFNAVSESTLTLTVDDFIL